MKDNLCFNKLIVCGKRRHEVEILVRRIDGREVFDFSQVIPCPLTDGTRAAFYWRLEHWGTGKLGFYPEVAEHKSKLHIHFETLESPPEHIIRKLIAKHPDLRLTFFYENKAEGFQGMIVGTGGVVTRDTYKEGLNI